jgi:hypothetical protein
MKLPFCLLAAALLLPLASPLSQAQSPDDGTLRVLDDRAGDVKLAFASTDQDPAGRWVAADLRSLDVRETPEAFTFTLTVASLKPSPEVPIFEDTGYGIEFRHNDRQFRIEMQRQDYGTGADTYGYLEVYDPGRASYDMLGTSQQPTVDLDAGTLAFTVDRDLLVDGQGNAPHPEVPFSGWRVLSEGNPVFGASFGSFCLLEDQGCVADPFPAAHDAMPDVGNGTADLPIRFGVAQSGDARLSSESSTRASNGEATTIVYQVVGRNLDLSNRTFALSASGVPAGWQVTLPAERMKIPGNGSVTFPVLLNLPFAHQHGTYQKFLVELTSVADPASVGRIQLGVRFTNPPQPAGHHSTLWLHASLPQSPSMLPATDNPAADSLLAGSRELYMNALEQDPLDGHKEVPGSGCRAGGASLQVPPAVPPRQGYCWSIPLSPALQLGLDFDLQRTGKISIPFKTTLPMLGSTLEGELRHYAPAQADTNSSDVPGFSDTRERTVLATLKAKAPVDVGANTEGTFLEADLVPTPESDYVPYVKGASLVLELRVAFTRADTLSLGGSMSPLVQGGGTLTDLPLNEYRDRVAQVFASNNTLLLVATGPQDRATNPGKTVLFNLTLENHAASTGTFNLDLSGTHLAWAELLEPVGAQVRIGAGQSQPVSVAVRVPKDADQGDASDLVLSATSASDLNIRSLARLYTAVDTAKQYPDDAPFLLASGTGHAKKKAPGLESPLLLAGLAAVALCRRRR